VQTPSRTQHIYSTLAQIQSPFQVSARTIKHDTPEIHQSRTKIKIPIAHDQRNTSQIPKEISNFSKLI